MHLCSKAFALLPMLAVGISGCADENVCGNETCKPGQVCVEDTCVTLCSGTNDCPASGYVCWDEMCVTVWACGEDSDCDPLSHCGAGHCCPKGETCCHLGTDCPSPWACLPEVGACATSCSSPSQCRDGATCQNNVCQL